jgi:uncharacterized protein YciI
VSHYVVICKDANDSAARRGSSLDDHRAYVDSKTELIVTSGPLVGDDTDTRIGQFYLVEAVDRATVDVFVAEDPFTRAGVFDVIEVTRLEPKFRSGRRI